MLTIKDLGKKLKRENPGTFDHLSDEQVGKAAKKAAEAKGSSEYKEYKDTTIQIREPQQSITVISPVDELKSLMKDLAGDRTSLISIEGLDGKIETLIKTFDPHSGWFSSWIGVGRTNRQREMAVNITEIERQIIDQYTLLAEKIRTGKEEEIKFKQFVAINAIELLNIQAQAIRIDEASKLGIPEANHTAIKVQDITEKKQLKRDKKRAKFELDQKIKEAKAMSKIRINEQVELAEGLSNVSITEKVSTADIEWQRFKNEKDLDVQVAILANLKPVAEIAALTQSLMGILQSIQKFKQLPQTADIVDAIEIFQNSKENLKKAIDERFEGLLQNSKR